MEFQRIGNVQKNDTVMTEKLIRHNLFLETGYGEDMANALEKNYQDAFSEIVFSDDMFMNADEKQAILDEMSDIKDFFEVALHEGDFSSILQSFKEAGELREQVEGRKSAVKIVNEDAFADLHTTTIPTPTDQITLPPEYRNSSEKKKKSVMKKLKEDAISRDNKAAELTYKSLQPVELDKKKRGKKGFVERTPIQTKNLLQSKWFRENVLNKKSDTGDTQEELMQKVINGDYSHMEQLDPVIRNILAAKYIEKCQFNYHEEPSEIIKRLLSHGGIGSIMNPLLRLGISLGLQGRISSHEGDTNFFKKLDEACNQRIMVETIIKEPEVEKLRSQYQGLPDGDTQLQADLTRNKQSQLFMAKTMLLTQLGKMKVTNGGNVGDWTGPVANAFAHCSRVAITLPASLETQNDVQIRQPALRDMIDSYTGKNGGLTAGFFKRGAATHSLNRKLRKAGSAPLEELKTLATFSNQQGMNVAVGGLGNDGIPGAGGQARLLKNDGSCGHIYMHLQEGDKDAYTGMLVGFESDSYKKTNQLGHTHGFGNGEFASSFGGQRLDEIGDKKGGRSVDLSGMDSYMFEKIMSGFTTWFQNMQNLPIESNARKDFNKWINTLCGARMSTQVMSTFLHDVIGVGDPTNPSFNEEMNSMLQFYR